MEPVRKAAFLDRDGVINVDRGYVFKIEDFEFMPGALEAIKLLNDCGRLVFVVTNQSGIGRGYYTESQFQELTTYMLGEIERTGGKIEKVYYCPHHPEGSGAYRKDCDCRKPKPGMILAAAEDYNLDLDSCFLIGDKATDLAAAEEAGTRAYLFTGGRLDKFVQTILHGLEG